VPEEHPPDSLTRDGLLRENARLREQVERAKRARRDVEYERDR